MSARLLVRAARLLRCDEALASESDALAALDDAALLIEDGRVVEVGPRPAIEAMLGATLPPVLEAPLVSPGLVDAHTHAAWVGSRHDEYAARMAGAGYEQIAARGGGIRASMRAVRAASLAELAAELQARLARMAELGVTTVEVKSGYGLDLESEQKQLGAIACAAGVASLPRVVPTYLALHALPPEAEGDRPAFARRVAQHDLPELAREGLFRYVDAYVDRSAFSVAEARPALEKARELGAGLRLHVGQFADVGGAELAAELGAASVDHVEHLSEAAARALAEAGTRAVLLPVASYTLGMAPPDLALLRRVGLRLVVASDANPGTAPTESLPLAMALSVRSYGLSVDEAWLGATREAARSLGLDDVGTLRRGARADLVGWDLPHEAAVVMPWGTPRTRFVLRDGRRIAGHTPGARG